MFITFLVLGSLVYTLKQAGAVKSNTRTMDQMSEVVHTLLLIKADVRGALNILSPTEGSSSSLKLVRVDPDLSFAQRVDLGVDDNPFETREQETVLYTLNNGVLRRRITSSDGSTRAERLLKSSKFQVQASKNPRLLTVVLEVETSRVKKSHTMKVAVK